MNQLNCDKDCDRCPFVTDPYDPQRYVCVKCGKEYSFRSVDAITAAVVAVGILFILLLLYTDLRSQEAPKRPMQRAPRITLYQKND